MSASYQSWRVAKPARMLGMLRREDVVRAYSHAMLDRVETQVRRPVLPSEFRGTRIVQVTVDASGPLAGLALCPAAPTARHAGGRDRTAEPKPSSRAVTPSCATATALQILVRDDAIAALHEHLAQVGPLRRAASHQ